MNIVGKLALPKNNDNNDNNSSCKVDHFDTKQRHGRDVTLSTFIRGVSLFWYSLQGDGTLIQTSSWAVPLEDFQSSIERRIPLQKVLGTVRHFLKFFIIHRTFFDESATYKILFLRVYMWEWLVLGGVLTPRIFSLCLFLRLNNLQDIY